LYPLLKHKPEFLFEAAQSLSKTGQYEKANEYLERAVLLSSDPMLYYVMAKNEQCLGEYRQAEKHLLHAIDILPERIYPYYLLMNLYTEPSYFQPAKLKMAIDSVLTKKPKVESSAIKEMKEKARSMLNNTSI
jgi:tetratricopeptide (TPR) repeat protein